MVSARGVVFIKKTLMPSVASGISASLLTWMVMDNERLNEKKRLQAKIILLTSLAHAGKKIDADLPS
jgi:hypothetical protein